MALRPADPPKAARKAVHATLADPTSAEAFRTPAARQAAADGLALSTPHRVALLPLDRIGPKTSLRSDVQMRGWRFLVHHGDDVVAAAHTVAGARGRHSFGHLNQGPFVAGTEEAIRRAETHRVTQQRHFEPIFLMVPALYVTALWLRDLEGDRDRLMVMPPAPQGFTPYRMVTPDDFVARLVRLAGVPRRRPAKRRARTTRR
ncbi:MAG: hypothetical protein HY060_16330 [Proteobacteria bacterium]|nr:hypothetical protein [Pseudomonadota bacterium]